MSDPKQVMNAETGTVAEVIAEYGEWYWLKERGHAQPYMVGKRGWPELVPQIGDVWGGTPDGSGSYRVIGVDEKRGCYYLIPRADFHAGGWPQLSARYQMEVDLPDETVVYIRQFPERGLILRERPK